MQYYNVTYLVLRRMADLAQPALNALSSCKRDVKTAIDACRLRGARMTELRQTVLTLLWNAERPLGAYEIREQLSEATGRAFAAPSVYRTLDFLCEQRVAARIESRNAYVACNHPEHNHTCVFLVCELCGDAVEIENPEAEMLINEDARRLGFAVKRRIVEFSGHCAPCQ